jgi:hypothetical protein
VLACTHAQDVPYDNAKLHTMDSYDKKIIIKVPINTRLLNRNTNDFNIFTNNVIKDIHMLS